MWALSLYECLRVLVIFSDLSSSQTRDADPSYPSPPGSAIASCATASPHAPDRTWKQKRPFKMNIRNSLLRGIPVLGLWLSACGSVEEQLDISQDRIAALENLQQKSKTSISLQFDKFDSTRVMALEPGGAIPTHVLDPGEAALSFLRENRAIFQLNEAEAADFQITNIDMEKDIDLHHIRLQRMYAGIPVLQGIINMHMNSANDILRVTGHFYKITPPSNQIALTSREAAAIAVAANELGVLDLTQMSAHGLSSIFHGTGLNAPLEVELLVYAPRPDFSRVAYQISLSWRDHINERQAEVVIIDAESGDILHEYNPIQSQVFIPPPTRGLVYAKSPGVNPIIDARTLELFPSEWISANSTLGNNAYSFPDLRGDNTPLSTDPQVDRIFIPGDGVLLSHYVFNTAHMSIESSIVNAFYLVNKYHDLTYALGFTESAGNFQRDNFGRGGAANDPILVEVRDGAYSNNAFFHSVPDGSMGVLELAMFNVNGGTPEDPAFDPSVVYHEYTHGMSTRLVGGGAQGCLGGVDTARHPRIQSGGMGEGWSDFMAASFLNDPVSGAYVSGKALRGVRRASMASSPFTYADVKSGAMSEEHDAGEVWAAALWAARKALGAAVMERLVVTGMKLTPCHPTMLDARDAIVAADGPINGGVNKCKLLTAFASRQMGSGAMSPDDTSTSAITLSTNLPPECGKMFQPQTFVATDLPKSIPDNNSSGIRSELNVSSSGAKVLRVVLDANISHTYRGDLIIQVVAPGGQVATLSNREGESTPNWSAVSLDITSYFTPGSDLASGQWRLFVRDLAAVDVGTINSFQLTITTMN